MAKKPPVPLTKAQAKLEAKIFDLLQRKRYADARAAVKDLTKNSTGRKLLQSPGFFQMRTCTTRLLRQFVKGMVNGFTTSALTRNVATRLFGTTSGKRT